MRRPHLQVVLSSPDDVPGDLVVEPAREAGFREPRTLLVAAPKWAVKGGSELDLANAYRFALAGATEREVRSLVLAGSLSRGPWPVDDVVRVGMTVLMSTPSTVREVVIAAPTPALLEAWAEALLREP